MNKILNFIFSKKDEGVYRTYKILGIKIITKPIELKLNMIENNIIHQINQVNNQIEKIYFYPFIDKYIDIQKDKYDYDIENILSLSKKIFFSELQFHNDKLFLRYLFKGEFQFFNDFHSKADIMIIWGMNMYYHNARTIEMALATDTKLLIAEDGFIR